jgi:hypothetical protein
MTSKTTTEDKVATPGRAVSRGIFMVGLVAVLMMALAPLAQAQAPPAAAAAAAQSSVSPTIIVIGFVGGFVSNKDNRHPEVQLAERLSEQDIAGVHAAAFENGERGEARREILRWLDTNGDGRLSTEEKLDAHIILYGHSWGGSAVNKLARDLNRRGIPVAMTIQVDSINKVWGDDCVVPPNVEEALNFYQTRGLAHGCPALRAVDPSRTRILGSYRFDYTAQPSECSTYSWTNRHFLRLHEAMDCDPRVWSQVDQQIQAQIKTIAQARPADAKAELAAANTAGKGNPAR